MGLFHIERDLAGPAELIDAHQCMSSRLRRIKNSVADVAGGEQLLIEKPVQGAGVEGGGGIEEDFLVLAGDIRLDFEYGAVLGGNDNRTILGEYAPALGIVFRERRDYAVIEKPRRNPRRPILHNNRIQALAIGAGATHHIACIVVHEYLTMHGTDCTR